MYKKLDYFNWWHIHFSSFLLILYSKPIVMHISHEIGTKVLFFFAANPKLAEYYKIWGFFPVDDEPFNKRLTKDWQNEYSQKCIFMYMPVAEIVNR